VIRSFSLKLSLRSLSLIWSLSRVVSLSLYWVTKKREDWEDEEREKKRGGREEGLVVGFEEERT
jgi:hypothetical protein